MKTIAYQGIPGSFSHQAACTYFGNNIKLISKDNFGGVFEAVERGEVEWGILPVENSSIGVISKVFDLLYEYDLNIQGELYLEVQHNLLVLPNTRLEDIDEVYSHPQAIEQCSQFLSQHLNWKVIPFFDTAKSAEWVKKQGWFRYAAIASAEAAKLYDLDILVKNIHDNPLNYTRFIITNKKEQIDSACNKISMIITLHHEPGSLYKVIEHFAQNEFNMLKIQSRPIMEKPFEYMFYIDFEGNLYDRKTEKMLEDIKEHCADFKIIGNYKAGVFNHVL